MFKRVLEIGEESCLVEEFSCLETRETTSQRVFRHFCDRLKKRIGYVPANYRSGLQQALVLGREAVDPHSENGLYSPRHLAAHRRAKQAVVASITPQRPR